jgi:hypothetical protein
MWNPNDAAADKIIAVYREVDLRERSSWPAHLEWMVNTTRQFRNVFGPRLRDMDLTPVATQEDVLRAGT